MTGNDPPTVLSAKTQAAELPEKLHSSAVTVTPDLACMPLVLPLRLTLANVTLAAPAAAAVILIPSPVLSRITEFLTFNFKPLLSVEVMPSPANLKITQSSTFTVFAWTMFMPLVPLHAPLIDKPRIVITSVAVALMMTPVVNEARIPAMVPVPSIVIDLVMVTVPKPPGSNASISPQFAVLAIAPAKVLQGAVRLQGLASSPTPDTHVRVAWAFASETKAHVKTNNANTCRAFLI